MIYINYLKIGGIFSDSGTFWSNLFGAGNANPEVVTKILQEYTNYIQYQNMFLMMWESVSWGAIKGLYWINTSLENTIYKSFELKNILNAAGLDVIYIDLISKVVAILCVLTLMYLGIKFAVSKTPPKPKNILINLILSMVLIFGGSTMIDEGLNLTKSFYGDVTNAEKASGREAPSFQIIKDNVYDVSTVMGTASNKLDTLTSKNRNGLTEKNFKRADINSVLIPDQIDKVVDDLPKSDPKIEKLTALKYRLVLDENGKTTPIEIDDSWLGSKFYTSGYRRYTSFNGSIFMGECSLAVAYLFILFTLVTCIIELGFKKFYLVIAASTDLEHGQRTKTAVMDIVNCLLLISFTVLELTIYTHMLTGLSDLKASGTINSTLYIVGLIGLTRALFKGSQAVTKIFGVDTNLSNDSNGVVGTLGAIGLTKGIAKGAGSTVKNTAKGLNSIRKSAFGNGSNSGQAEPSTVDNSVETEQETPINDTKGKPREENKSVSETLGKRGPLDTEEQSIDETDINDTDGSVDIEIEDNDKGKHQDLGAMNGGYSDGQTSHQHKQTLDLDKGKPISVNKTDMDSENLIAPDVKIKESDKKVNLPPLPTTKKENTDDGIKGVKEPININDESSVSQNDMGINSNAPISDTHMQKESIIDEDEFNPEFTTTKPLVLSKGTEEKNKALKDALMQRINKE